MTGGYWLRYQSVGRLVSGTISVIDPDGRGNAYFAAFFKRELIGVLLHMEQITKLLFATTFLSIFCYLLLFSSMGQAGNGGEYWGFDGYVEPWKAADTSFDKRDYRFLQVVIRNPLGGITRDAPAHQGCDNHPFGKENALRLSSEEPVHGTDSVRLATNFARRYNESMMWRLAEMMDNRCELWTD